MLRHLIDYRCYRNRRCEARVLTDEPCGHETAVARAGHPQTVGVGHAAFNQVINAGEIIMRICPAHLAEHMADERLTSPRAAPGIRKEHRVPRLYKLQSM